jgi:hypothetical protein
MRHFNTFVRALSQPFLWVTSLFSGAPCSSCFLGHYFVATSSIAPDVPHTFALLVPPVPPGAFQGVFWMNIEQDPSIISSVVWC